MKPHLIKKRDSDTLQHGELRSDRGSGLVNEFFLRFSSFNFNDTFKTGRQERHRSTSSSSSSSSPTTATSSDNETREGENQSEIDSPPVPVSSSNVDDRTEKPVVCFETNHEHFQANQKFPKTHKIKTTIERETRCLPTQVEHRQVLKSWSGCKNSEKNWWMIEFLKTETLTPFPLMKHLWSPYLET